MASFQIQNNTGGKGEVAEHGLYIGREGRFTEEKYGPVERVVSPTCRSGHDDMEAFWTASNETERSNGNTYREYELALPRSLIASVHLNPASIKDDWNRGRLDFQDQCFYASHSFSGSFGSSPMGQRIDPTEDRYNAVLHM